MSGTLKQCPNCGHKPSSALFGGGYLPVKKCRNCQDYFCYHCKNSNQGRKCPHCYSEKYDVYQNVYP